MRSDVVEAALAGALFVAGPIAVAVGTTGIEPYSLLTTTGLLTGCVYALSLVAGTYGPGRVDRLWSFRPVRAVLWWSLIGLLLGAVWDPALGLEPPPGVAVDAGVLGVVGAALSGVGGIGLVLTLGRANRRRIASEEGPLLELGRATGDEFGAQLGGVVLVPLGLLYVTTRTNELLQGAGSGADVDGVLVGLMMVYAGLEAVNRSWRMAGSGLLRRYRVYSWDEVERVVVRDETVTT